MTDPTPAAPAGPVQPTPRPEGETACGVCGREKWRRIMPSEAATEASCAREVSDECADECYRLGYARLRAEAARLKENEEEILVEAHNAHEEIRADLTVAREKLAEREAEAAAQAKQIEALTGRLAYCVDLAAHEQQLAERDAEVATNEKKPTGEVDADGSKTASALWECAGPDWHFRMVQRVAVLRTEKEALIDCDGAGRDEPCDKCLGCVSATARKSAEVLKVIRSIVFGEGISVSPEAVKDPIVARILKLVSSPEGASEAAAQTARVAEMEQQRNEAIKDYTDTLKSRIALEKQLAEVTRERDEARGLWIRENAISEARIDAALSSAPAAPKEHK